jgi:hypothetical protein
MPVKFEGGLSISFMIDKQVFTKKGIQNVTIKKKKKVRFSSERGRQTTLKFDLDPEVRRIYRLIPRTLDFLE